MLKKVSFLLNNKAWPAIILISYISVIAAKPSFAFNITPSRGEIVVEAGGECTGEYSVTNQDDKSVKVKIFADNWVIQKGRDATKWLKVSPSEIVIPPKASRVVTYTVKAPKEAEGEYTSSIVFRSLDATPVGDAIDAITQLRLAIYIVIKGTEVINGEISNLEVLNVDPLRVSIKIKNDSNVHIRPKGEMVILKDNEPVNTLKLNTSEGPIFPDAEGEIGPREDMVLEPGDYKAAAKVELTPDIVINKEVEFSVPQDEEGAD